MEKKIISSSGKEYMTVALSGNFIEFRNFGEHRVTIKFDVKTLDQLVPFLKEVQFWNKLKEKEDEAKTERAQT